MLTCDATRHRCYTTLATKPLWHVTFREYLKVLESTGTSETSENERSSWERSAGWRNARPNRAQFAALRWVQVPGWAAQRHGTTRARPSPGGRLADQTQALCSVRAQERSGLLLAGTEPRVPTAPAMSTGHFLPSGGRFTLSKSKSFVEQIQHAEADKPGPGTYDPVEDRTFDRLPQGGHFNQSNAKSQLEWTVYYSSQLPGPGEYAPKKLSSDGGIINKNRSKSNLEQVIHDAEQVPGPGTYEHESMPLPQGGRVSKSNARSEFEETIHRGSKLPGPGEYDFPRWPAPSHGRFSSPADASSIVDHLHKPGSGGGEDPGPRPIPTLDIYRDGSFRLPRKELEQSMRAQTKQLKQSGKKEKLVKHTTAGEFAQARIREAQKRGEGTAEEAIACIFDHLEYTKGKVLDVFKQIDKDGNGTLDCDEFRTALQILGLDLPRSQALQVLDEFDEDGDGTIDIEEFITHMRNLAKSRRADRRAEEAIPEWIREADKAKPVALLDLGWRQLAPDREEPKQKSAAQLAQEKIRKNRPESGRGTPFATINGGRWRAGETSALRGEALAGWQAAHAGWQPNSSSEFGVAERWPLPGSGTKESGARLQHANRLTLNRTAGNDQARGTQQISTWKRSPRRRAQESGDQSRGNALTREEHLAWASASQARVQAVRERDLALYGEDGRVRVEGGALPRWPSGKPTHTVEDAAKIAALSTADGRFKAFESARFAEELAELQHCSLIVPVETTATRRLSTRSGKRRPDTSHRISNKHPLLRRSTSSTSRYSSGSFQPGRMSVPIDAVGV